MLLKYSPHSKHSQRAFTVGIETIGDCFDFGFGSSKERMRANDLGAEPEEFGTRKLCRCEKTFEVHISNSKVFSELLSGLLSETLLGGLYEAVAVISERKI
jgi:hypothetical protein